MPRALGSEFQTGFIEWWEKIEPRARSKMDITLAQNAFVAGYKRGSDRTLKTYRYSAGRWKVTVNAPSASDAKIEAAKLLTQRAEKFSATPPPGGWKLVPLRDRA